MKLERELALQDLITGVLDFVQDVEYPSPTRVYLLDQLAAVECVKLSLSLHLG